MPNMSGMDMPGMNMSNMNMSGMRGMSGTSSTSQANNNNPAPNQTFDTTFSGNPPADPTPAQTRKELRLEFNVLGNPLDSQAPLGLSDLQRIATEHNPTLIQARAQVEGETGKAKQAGLYINPAIAYNGDLLGLPRAGAGEWQGGMLEQEIILGGKLKLSRQKYLARVEAAKQQLQAQTLKVSNDVQIHYYHVLAAAERLKLQNELWKSVRDHWLTIGEMSNLGEASQADRYLANVTQEEQRLKVLESENDLMYAWENLTTILGVDMTYRGVNGELDGNPELIPWQSLMARLITDSPQLGEARAKLRSDEITLKREKRQMIPNLIISGGAGYDQLDSGFAARANLQMVNIPLFDRNQGTIQQAKADLSRQKAQVQLVELQLRRKLANHFREYVTAVQHVQSYKNVILPDLQKRYTIMLKSYADTRTDWPAVLETQRDFFKLRLAYIDHLVTWREQEVLLNGFLLTGALIAPEGVTPPGHIDATPKPR